MNRAPFHTDGLIRDLVLQCTNCSALPGFPCTGRAVALYVFQGGNTLAMCQYSLDLALDVADECPDLEPAELRFLQRVPVAA